nr:hypothetical protein GCM10025732_03510 [Glycomyces mayteni]
MVLRGGGVEERGDRTVRVQAGQVWDDFVAWTVAHERSGVECLSGIPGSVGATPIQNVGAYGQEVAQTIESVRVWDREKDEIRDWTPVECGFAYRQSAFKNNDRYFVMSVDFALEPSALSQPVAYAELAKRLAVAIGDRAPSPRPAPRSSNCAAARAWSSTRPTTTPGAPAPSSPTPSSAPTSSTTSPPAPEASPRTGRPTTARSSSPPPGSSAPQASRRATAEATSASPPSTPSP